MSRPTLGRVTIVSAEDLRNYMGGIRYPAAAVATVPMILAGLQASMEAFLRCPIEPGPEITEATVTVTADGALRTREWPIAAVSAVLGSDGTTVAFTFTANGDLFIPGGGPYDASGYTVTYTPGLPPSPLANAKLMIMRAAEREVAPKHDDSRQPDGTTNGRRAQQVPAPGWQKGELRPLSRWRSRSGSVYSRPRPWLPDVGPSYDAYAGYYPGAIEVGGVVSATSPMMFEEGDATLPGGPG